METRLIVSAVIENRGGFLFGKKHENVGPYPNTWHLLGGGLKQGEPLVAALEREVFEEAGIKIKNIKPVSLDEDCEPNKNGVKTHYIFLVFRAKYKSGALKPADDIAELKWIKKSDLSKAKLNMPTIKLFKKLKIIK